MIPVNLSGIVLRHAKYSDSSAVVKVLTREKGLLSVMMRGIRSKKGSRSRMAALQPLSQVEFLCQFKEDRDLQSGSGIKLREVYSSVFTDPVKSSIVFFIDEILYRSIGDDADEGLYDFVESSLNLLDNMEDPRNFHLSFLFRLTRFMGFYPGKEGFEGAVCFDLTEGSYRQKLPDHDHYITGKLLVKFVEFLETPIGEANRIKLSREERTELLSFGVDYYKLHRPGVKEINSLPILQAVFKDY